MAGGGPIRKSGRDGDFILFNAERRVALVRNIFVCRISNNPTSDVCCCWDLGSGQDGEFSRLFNKKAQLAILRMKNTV